MTRGTDLNMCPPTGGLRNYRKGYEDGLNRGKDELAEILDKISAEIKDCIANEPMTSFREDGLREALEVVEKYKKEGAT